ncbi:SDR family oxidoreductase [bacterium]|nr:SDR family oxidoreductase [bacterium]NUN44086.1 SDR family oxidoreductase [bacterium]
MKTALITGASSGIGLATAQKLTEMGYRVYGLARNFDKTTWRHANFVPIVCDVRDINALEEVEKKWPTKESLDVLIHSAGFGYFAPHEEIPLRTLQDMVTTNLTAPLILTHLFLRRIREQRGFIIHIASVTALEPSRMGAAYAATKAGLRHFSASLFDECRKQGVKVVNINPDITRTAFYDNLNFSPSDETDTYIEPQEVADTVGYVLTQRDGTVISEITIRPQRLHVIKRKHHH